MITASAALAAALALLLGACGWQRPSQPAGATTAYDATEQRAPFSATGAAASRKAAATSAPAADSTAPTTTAPAAQPQATQPTTTTQLSTTTQTTTAQTAAAPAQPFGGAELVLATPGQVIDESLHRSPHAVYAADLGGYRFAFQPRAYNPGGSFDIDVYLYNRDGSYSRVDTLTSAAQNAGVYSIVLVTPNSAVGKDERQNITLISNVYRFEISTAQARYSVRYVANHAPYALTAYYALDAERLRAGAVKFSKFSF